MKYFKMAADLGSSEDLYRNGNCLYEGCGIEQNHVEAVRYFKLTLYKGNSAGLYSFARCLQFGDGVQKNVPEAIRIYKMAGEDVPASAEKALEFYRKSAELSDGTGFYNLGLHYYRGNGVPVDCDFAFKCFKRAHELGFAFGSYYYALCFIYGKSVGGLYNSGCAGLMIARS